MSAGLRERLLTLSASLQQKADTVDRASVDDWNRGRASGLRFATGEINTLAAALDGQGDAAALREQLAWEEHVADDTINKALDAATKLRERAKTAEAELANLKAAGDAAPRVAPSQWLPIETAPKDSGTRCLFVDEHGERFVAFWSSRWECWLTTPSSPDGVFGNATKPIGWMPISEPPATSGSGDEARSIPTSDAAVSDRGEAGGACPADKAGCTGPHRALAETAGAFRPGQRHSMEAPPRDDQEPEG